MSWERIGQLQHLINGMRLAGGDPRAQRVAREAVQQDRIRRMRQAIADLEDTINGN